MNADSRVMEHFPSTLTAEESNAMVVRIESHFEEHGYGLWAVVSKAHEELLGFCGLATPTFETGFGPAVEVGWRFAHAHWGQGYASEAASAVLDFGFDDAGLTQIYSWALPANQRSIRVMRRIGLTPAPELDFDHPRFLDDDRLRRHVVYRITREEWLRQRTQ
jgi:RimJ/RimL family protein N-acetyltransferase